MRNTESGKKEEKEREAGEKRVSRWPIIPLIAGPVGILILLCYVASAKPPVPVAPSASAGVNEQVLLNEAEELKSQAEQLYQRAEGEEDTKKRNELCDKALELCDKALERFDKIREAYEERGLLGEGTRYQWDESNRELNELRKRISFIKGF